MLTNTHELSDITHAARANAMRFGRDPSDAERRSAREATRRIARHVTCQNCRDVADFCGDDFEILMREAV
jgi:hypothetical protein